MSSLVSSTDGPATKYYSVAWSCSEDPIPFLLLTMVLSSPYTNISQLSNICNLHQVVLKSPELWSPYATLGFSLD